MYDLCFLNNWTGLWSLTVIKCLWLFLQLCWLGSGRRILIFPKGNNVDHLSMYLDVADSATLPYGWSRYAQFSLAVVNQIHNKYSIRKGIFVYCICLKWYIIIVIPLQSQLFVACNLWQGYYVTKCATDAIMWTQL